MDVQEIPLDLDKRGTVEVTKDDVTARIQPASLAAFLRNGWTGKDADGNPFPELKPKTVADKRGLVGLSQGEVAEEPEPDKPTVALPVPEDEAADELTWVQRGSADAFQRSGWTVADDQGEEVVTSSANTEGSHAGLVEVTSGEGDGTVTGYVAPGSVDAFVRNGWSATEPTEEAPSNPPPSEDKE